MCNFIYIQFMPRNDASLHALISWRRSYTAPRNAAPAYSSRQFDAAPTKRRADHMIDFPRNAAAFKFAVVHSIAKIDASGDLAPALRSVRVAHTDHRTSRRGSQ